MRLLSPFATHIFCRRLRKISPLNNFIRCSLAPSTKDQTKVANFLRLKGLHKLVQRQMNLKRSFFVVIFRWRLRKPKLN